MATVKENLIAVKALIDTPAKWTQERLRGVRDDGTLCFCIYGAIGAVCEDAKSDDALTEALRAVAPSRHLSIFNDAESTTHADVMALFDRAIAAQDEDRLQTRDQMLRGLTP